MDGHMRSRAPASAVKNMNMLVFNEIWRARDALKAVGPAGCAAVSGLSRKALLQIVGAEPSRRFCTVGNRNCEKDSAGQDVVKCRRCSKAVQPRMQHSKRHGAHGDSHRTACAAGQRYAAEN